MSRKNSKEENLMTTGNKAGYIYLQKQKDFYISDTGKKETVNFNKNRLPDLLEDSSINIIEVYMHMLI